MDLAKKLRNPFIQQYAVEILFPLLGYFVFDWSMLIIGVYYLVDHLSSQVMFYRRAYAINAKSTSPESINLLVVSVLFFCFLFTIETIALGYFIKASQGIETVELLTQFYTFAKSELWFLFPVVLLMYYLKDQFTFFMPRHFLKYNYKKILLFDSLNAVIITLLFLIGGLIWIKLQINNAIVIFAFIALKIAFDLTVKQLILRKSLLKMG